MAKDSSGRVLGYASTKANEANGFSRSRGQVAVLAQIAVIPEARGNGIGTVLMQRSLATLRMLGYSRVFAQMQAELREWYRPRGWDVLAAGRSLAWVEPPIEQDRAWDARLPARSFAPLLRMAYLPRFPHLAQFRVGDGQPLLEVEFDAVGDDRAVMRRAHQAVGAAVVADPALADQLPWALAGILSEEPGVPRPAAEILADRARRHGWPPIPKSVATGGSYPS